MKKYNVRSVDGKYTIQADIWTVGKEGLIFWRKKNKALESAIPIEDNHEAVAWFTTWDYWMLQNVE